MGKKLSSEELFWLHVNKDGPLPANNPELGNCWLWVGNHSTEGYGKLERENREIVAHRFAWFIEYGDFPETGIDLHHICKNKSCVNIAHLQLLTKIEHAKIDGAAHYQRQKTHCPKGHEYSIENTTVVRRNGVVGRACKTCSRARTAEYRQKNPDKVKASVKTSKLKHRDKINRKERERYHRCKNGNI